MQVCQKFTRKNYKEIDVYYIGYVTFKEIANCNNINSVNPLYLMIDKMIGHFEEKSENKYLVLDDVNETKEISQKHEAIKLRLLTIIIRSVFSEDGKFYPQLFLDDALYEL